MTHRNLNPTCTKSFRNDSRRHGHRRPLYTDVITKLIRNMSKEPLEAIM